MKKANILFVCVENAGRSQMAEGLARHLGKDHIEAWSAGSKPSGRLNPAAVEAMRERGIDISGHRSKVISDLPELQWDYVVTMGCGDSCPFVPSRARLDWNIPDSKGLPKERVRDIFKQIEDEVVLLVKRTISEGHGAK